MNSLIFKNLPCWYSLWWDSHAKRLCIKVHRYYLSKTTKHDLTSLFESALGIRPDLFYRYQPILGQPTFGYNGLISVTTEDHEWVTYSCSIPEERVKTGKTCPFCEGQGKGDEHGSRCLKCDGDGEERICDSLALFAVTTSLSIFLWALSDPLDESTPSDKTQWFTVICSDSGRTYIGGETSPLFVDLLSKLTTNQLEPVREVGRFVHETILGKSKSTFAGEFRVEVNQGRLFMSCPGHACNLEVISPLYGIRAGEGLQLGCHNVDGAVQMLTLLCMLGGISEVLMQKHGS